MPEKTKIDHILLNWTSIGTFFLFLLIESHSLELGAILLTYFVKIFLRTLLRNTEITTYPHWAYVRWWWQEEWIHWHYNEMQFIINPYRDQHHWEKTPTCGMS